MDWWIEWIDDAVGCWSLVVRSELPPVGQRLISTTSPKKISHPQLNVVSPMLSKI